MPHNTQAVRQPHRYSVSQIASLSAPSVAQQPQPSKRPTVKTISGLLFEASRTHHKLAFIPTLMSHDQHRFPVLEMILGAAAARAVHECVVTLLDEDKGVEHRFLVVCQTGSHLRANKSVAREYDGKPWKGSLVVMQMGSRESVVNLTHRRLAIDAVLR